MVAVLLTGGLLAPAAMSSGAVLEIDGGAVPAAGGPTFVRIDGDTDLLEWRTSHGWEGNGTSGSPVVIDGARIGGSAFFLGNISLFVSVKDVNATGSLSTSVWQAGAGVQLWNCSNVSLVRVRSYDNAYCGILLQQCRDVIVRDGNVSAQGIGLVADEDCYGIQVLNNTFYDNGVGLSVSAQNSTIAWCDIIGNDGAGLVLQDGSSGNAVYRNAFLRNDATGHSSLGRPAQAVDNGTGNNWNRTGADLD
ncbi:MAG TPA: right-handed parallel beta-helix repeat-containing protein, partial [Methanomassiliicoccales archaeon]|nr:right-handed parallel beta-helix repeat-containing protein [Methanomassiliicoccales archaeon]